MDTPSGYTPHPKLALLWVRSFAPAQFPLSLNITREIATYCEDFPVLLDVYYDRVMLYRPTKHQWEMLYYLKKRVDVSYYTGILSIGRGRVILCGGLTFIGTP